MERYRDGDNEIKYLEANQSKISKCIENKLSEGVMKIPHDSAFWRLRK